MRVQAVHARAQVAAAAARLIRTPAAATARLIRNPAAATARLIRTPAAATRRTVTEANSRRCEACAAGMHSTTGETCAACPVGAPARPPARRGRSVAGVARAPAGAASSLVAPSPGADVAGVSPVPVQTWEGRAQSHVQMWAGRAQSRGRRGRGEPSPGAEVGGASPVPGQTWEGRAQSRGKRGRGEPVVACRALSSIHRARRLHQLRRPRRFLPGSARLPVRVRGSVLARARLCVCADHCVKGTDYCVKGTDHCVKGTDHCVKGTDNRVKGTDHCVKGTDDARSATPTD